MDLNVTQPGKDSTILFLIEVELETYGYKVLTADTSAEGLEKAAKERPDVIISDIKMPGIDGYGLIRRIRQTEGSADVPAIALTGLSARADRDKALAAGFNACLSKPVEGEELAVLIKKLTER